MPSKSPKKRDDTDLLTRMRDRLVWDGYGYWLPDICVREMEPGHDFCPQPTMEEFRAALWRRLKEK